MAVLDKKPLSLEDLESQTALQLPERKMLALVNVQIIDVLSHNQTVVSVPIGVAANLCPSVSLALLLAASNSGRTACTATVSHSDYIKLTK